MAAASFHTYGLGGGSPLHHGDGKGTKARARSTVKPILKKLHHSSTCSEKNSLDLDRGWEEQPSPHPGYVAPEYSDGAYPYLFSQLQDYDAHCHGAAMITAIATAGASGSSGCGSGSGGGSGGTRGGLTGLTGGHTSTSSGSFGVSAGGNTAGNGASAGGGRSARDISFTLAGADLTNFSSLGVGLSTASTTTPAGTTATSLALSASATTTAATAATTTTTTPATLSHSSTANTVYSIAGPSGSFSANNNSHTSNANSSFNPNHDHHPSHSHAHTHSQSHSHSHSRSYSHHSRHVRSTSGASHISVANSTASGGRNGSFVHPFQQTPRTSTPPLLSYANSIASFDNTRDYSADIIDEHDDDSSDDLEVFALPQSGSKTFQSPPAFGRPSLPSQRPTFQSDVAPALRLITSPRTGSASASRAPSYPASAGVSQIRQSDAQLSSTASVTVVDESPLETPAVGSYSPHCGSNNNSASPMSPLRNSLDMNNFRIRSRSDVDTANRQEQIRAARRKFEEKERAKDEKHAREQVRKRERADIKEAQRHERAQSRKGSLATVGRISSSDIRPAISRKSTSHSRTLNEKTSFPDETSVGNDHELSSVRSPGRAGEVQFESTKRTRTSAKRKTNGAWTSFVLWLRTRLLKLGRR